MVFALQPEEPVAQGILRVLLEQIDSAAGYLSTQEHDAVEAVHQTRKSLKRVRTMLRLLRQALGKSTYAKENACFSALGKKLSPLRDTHMHCEVVARLGQHTADSPYHEAIAPVEQALKARRLEQSLSETLLYEMLGELERARARIKAWDLNHLQSDLRASLARGTRRMAKRARRAYALAYKEPTDPHFHNWRKRIKDLYYAARLFYMTRPGKLAPIVDMLDRLDEDLGDEHDLGLLAQVLHNDPQAMGGAVPVALLLQLAARRRAELRTTLRPIGAALHKKRPKQIARLLTSGMKSS